MGWLECRPGLACALIVLLAGCADAPSGTDTTATATGAAASMAAVATGTVTGLVVDDEDRPVADADVYLRDAPDLRDATDAAGRFQIGNVPLGEHTVVVAKVAFLRAEARVQVDEDGPAEVSARLRPVPQPAVPFAEHYLGRSFLSCGAKVGAITFTEVQLCQADPNNQPVFDFVVSVDRGLVSVLAELAWTPSLPGTAEALREELVRNPNCDALGACGPDVRYERVSGPSPLRILVGNHSLPFADNLEPVGPTTLSTYAHVSRDNQPLAVLVVQQPVDNYVTAFYHGEPAPGYTLVPSEGA